MSTYRKWLALIEEGTFTRSQVRQFAAGIAPVAHQEDGRGKRHNMSGEECSHLFRLIQRSPVRLTDEHTTLALEWFNYHAVKVLGMSASDRNHALENFIRFTYSGEYVRGDAGIWPEWNMVIAGNVIRYYAAPWQATLDGDRPAGYRLGDKEYNNG
jgi:hypothetical protein